MKLHDTTGGFLYEVTIYGKEEFGITSTELSVKGYILASSTHAIEIDVRCFQTSPAAITPDLIAEMYIDGVLRNIIKPRTGRGMPDGQFAEAKIDRGLILTTNGLPIMKNFRFADLDLDDGKVLSMARGAS